MRSLPYARMLLVHTVAALQRGWVPPPCTASESALLKAVLAKLPPGARVSADQLRSMMGVYSKDLCGLPLKQVGGSWSIALREVFGSGASEPFLVPEGAQWLDQRPPPPRETRCLGEVVAGSTTWVTNDPTAADEVLHECKFADATHLGLDCEWTPTMVKGQAARLSMLQLASADACLLLRVGQMPRPLSPRLLALLAAETPLKVC